MLLNTLYTDLNISYKKMFDAENLKGKKKAYEKHTH